MPCKRSYVNNLVLCLYSEKVIQSFLEKRDLIYLTISDINGITNSHRLQW